MRFLLTYVALIASLCALGATRAHAQPTPHPAASSKLTAEQLIARVDGPQESFAGLSGEETFVQLYLGLYRLDYTAKSSDVPVLLAAMLDQNRPLERRLCLAAFLLDLNHDAARLLVEDCLTGQHGAEAQQDATRIVAEPGPTWREETIVQLLTRGARSKSYDSSWETLCRRAGELKLQGAVEPLIAILRQRPTDREAALALGEIGDRRAIPILMKSVEHDGGIQPYHMYALRKLEAPGLPALLIRHLDARHLDASSTHTLFGAAHDVVDALGDLKSVEAIEPLQKLLATSADEDLNATIRLTLTRLTAANQQELAERLLHTAETAETSSERWSALQHVGQTGQQWAVPRLLQIAKTSTNSLVIHNSISAIAELGGDDAAAGLVSLFDDDFSHVPRSEMDRKGEVRTNFNGVVSQALTRATGVDLGLDPAAWRRYLKQTPQ